MHVVSNEVARCRQGVTSAALVTRYLGRAATPQALRKSRHIEVLARLFRSYVVERSRFSRPETIEDRHG